MDVNDPPIIRWYAATVIFRCMVNGQESNTFVGHSRDIPAIHRAVTLLQSHSPDAAYNLAVERARQSNYFFCGHIEEGIGTWEFAGLEDLQELPLRTSLDGALVWSRCVIGLPSSVFVYPKEQMTVFDPGRGWGMCVADYHDRKIEPKKKQKVSKKGSVDEN